MLSAKNINPCASVVAGARVEGGHTDSTRADNGFVDAVLEIVRTLTGVDFRCYRPAVLERRIANHLASVGVASNDEYLRLLRSSAAEPFRLLERITIKVSRFYRYATAFDYMRDVVLPALAKARAGEPLRIRSVGCGGGEEPYTFAMLLEAAGLEGVIEATDIDSTALNAARAGIYPLAAAAELPAPLVCKYLERVVVGGQPRYRIQDNLRARVCSSRADITAAFPASDSESFDLVSCRNVLIYLQRPAQVSATRRLLDILRVNGVLCLGEAEWPLPEFAEHLEPLPHKTRLFRLRAPQPFSAHHELNRARFRPGT